MPPRTARWTVTQSRSRLKMTRPGRAAATHRGVAPLGKQVISRRARPSRSCLCRTQALGKRRMKGPLPKVVTKDQGGSLLPAPNGQIADSVSGIFDNDNGAPAQRIAGGIENGCKPECYVGHPGVAQPKEDDADDAVTG